MLSPGLGLPALHRPQTLSGAASAVTLGSGAAAGLGPGTADRDQPRSTLAHACEHMASSPRAPAPSHAHPWTEGCTVPRCGRGRAPRPGVQAGTFVIG